MKNIKTKIKRAWSLTTLVAMLLGLAPMVAPNAVLAGTLISASGVLSDVQISAVSNLTLTFTTATAVESTGKIEVSSMYSFGNGSWDTSNISTLVSLNTDINGGGAGTPTFDSSTVSYSYGTFTLPLSGSGLNAGDTVTVIIPSLTNPSWEGTQSISLRTTNQFGTTIDGGDYGWGISVPVVVGIPEITGRVTGPDGVTGIQNSYVSAQNGNYTASGSATTDSQGNFSIFMYSYSYYGGSSSTTGTYTVNVQAPYNSQYTDALPITSVSVTDGSTTNLGTIMLTSPNVTGILVKNDGITPLQYVSVSLHNSNWTVSKWESTDASGNFSIGGLSAGTYTIEFGTPWDAKGLVPPANQTITLNSSADSENLGTISYSTAMKTISGQVLKSNGQVVTNAKVNAYRENGYGWSDATVDSSGNYSMTVGGGTWNVSIYPDWSAGYNNVDWTYNEIATKANFSNDNTQAESKTVNFTVRASTVTVTGRVLTPTGSPLPGNGSVSAYSKNGSGGYSQIGADGTFSFKIPAGTYDLTVYTWDNNYGSPAATNFTVEDDETYNTGDISVLAKNESIRGTVKDVNNNPLSGQYISAWKMNGSGWANTQSASDGTYTLSVFPGDWMISMYLDSGMMGGYSTTTTNYVYNDPPQKINIEANENSTGNDFIVKIADATIEGTVVDSNDNVLTDAYGYAYVSSGNTEKGYGMMMMGVGAPVTNGRFTLKVPAGTYDVGVNVPSGSGYTVSETVAVSISSNDTQSVSITALENNATISGYLKDSSGNIITGVSAWINADNGNMGYQYTSVDSTTGQYSLTVSAGDWRIGYWVSSSEYLRQSIGDNKVTAVANDTVSKDLILQQADSTISGTVTGPDDSPLSWVWVSVDTRAGENETDGQTNYWYSLGASTWTDGTYSIDVPSGTYYVKAYMPLSFGYINPEEVAVTVDAQTPGTVNLQFQQPDATITGTVVDANDSPVEDAMVWAYSSEGGYTQTNTDENGDYTLAVTKADEWHVGAVKETDTSYAKSGESLVDVPDSTATDEENLSLDLTGTMPEPVVATFDATNSKTITLEDGTIVSIPAGALASSGDVTVTATPKAEVPSQDGAQPISIGYDITATDSNGSEISTTFSSNVTITLPYSDTQLTAAGLTEDNLVPSYWDDTTAVWKPMDGVAVNDENNTISFSTNHFTEFSLVGASDTTPPSAPTNVTVTDPTTGGQLNLSWINPTDTDFASVNIYRSTTSGSLGTAVYTGVTTTSKSDTGLADGTTYYYTVRSVDTVSNESVNTTQVSGTPTTAGSTINEPGVSEEPVNNAPGVSNEQVAEDQQTTPQDISYTYFATHPNGTLITSPNTQSVYLLENGKKRPIANVQIFEARGYHWNQIITIQDSELNLYSTGNPINTAPDGSVFKGSTGNIYVISDGAKRYVTGPDIFTGLGYVWSQIVSVSDSHLTLYADGDNLSITTTHPNGTLVKATNGTSIYYLESGTKRGITTPEIFEANNFKWNRVISITQTELDTYTEGNPISTYPNGTLLKNTTDSKVYLVSDGKKRLITSPIFFEDMGYQWNNVVPVASSHLDLYTAGADVKISKLHPNGTLMKTEGNGAVYLLSEGKKRPFASAQIFEANGYQWSEIIMVKRSELEMYVNGLEINTYPTGTLLQGSDGKVYAIAGTTKRYITGPEVFTKLGYNWNNVKLVSTAHLTLYLDGDNLTTANDRPDGTLIQDASNNIYLIEGGVTRLITSPKIFTRWGFQWNNVIPVSGPELASYDTGNDLNTYPKTSILQDTSNNKVYLVSNGKKHWFTGPQVFTDMGYQWNHLIPVGTTELDRYETGLNVQ